MKTHRMITLKTIRLLKNKKIPLGLSLALGFILITYNNCIVIEASDDSISETATSPATIRTIADGNYSITNEEALLHLQISNNGNSYIMSIKSNARNEYLQEIGKLKYDENIVTFIPQNYAPVGCEVYHDDNDENEQYEFSQTSHFLTLQYTDNDTSEEKVLIFGDGTKTLKLFFGNNTEVSTCSHLEEFYTAEENEIDIVSKPIDEIPEEQTTPTPESTPESEEE